MRNGILAGYRDTVGSPHDRRSFAYFCSSSDSGASALYRYLSASHTNIGRDADSKAYGFSAIYKIRLSAFPQSTK